MNIKAIEEVTTRKEVVQRVECDKCRTPDIDTGDLYDVFEARLCIEIGTHYPEGRDVDETSMDLCKQCAEDLKDLLLANGYRLNVENT